MLKRIIRETNHDIREIGISAVSIVLVSLIYVFAVWFLVVRLVESGSSDTISLQLFQLIMPTLGAFGSVMLMQSVLDTEGCEICFSYSRSRLYWGIVRQLRFFVLFSVLLSGVTLAMSALTKTEFGLNYLLGISQSFCLMSVAFLGVCLSKKVGIGFVFIVAFAAVQLTIGREYDFLNRIYLFDPLLESVEQMRPQLVYSIVIGVFCWPLGQSFVRP